MTERRPAGWATAAGLGLDYADAILLRAVRDVHNSVSGRFHGVADMALRHRTAPHLIHSGISEAVFGSISFTLRRGASALKSVDQIRPIGTPLEDSAFGRHLNSALHGVIGDVIADHAPAMAFEMSIRKNGRDVRPGFGELAAAFPDATSSLVVFVHGLAESEDVWHRPARPKRQEGEAQPGSYGDRLQAMGWSPLYLRVNSGLPIAQSGVALHALLTRVVENWPVPVRRIALVGHSMGGLISRCAGDVQGAAPWRDRLTDIVTLSTPHLGSPVERAIATGMRFSEPVPELAPYHRIFRNRSGGVLDLSRGLPNSALPIPGVRYHLVSATTARTPEHPTARMWGDGLVQPASAFGERRNGGELFPGASKLHVPNANHFDVLNHDLVWEHLQGWLALESTPMLQEAVVVSQP